MPKGFSEQEKATIRDNLLQSCQEYWATYGYKKTSIDSLCQQVGISKGAFYIFFASKEHLFYETIKVVQQQLYSLVEEILTKEQNKQGIAKALQAVYIEYDKSPFLYNTSSRDFISFMNKLSQEEKQDIYIDSLVGARQMLDKPYVILRVEEEMALAVLSSLLRMIENKELMQADHFAVFDFMLTNMLDKIFE